MVAENLRQFRQFPRIELREGLYLATWFPAGVFDDGFGNQLIAFIETEDGEGSAAPIEAANTRAPL